MNPRKNFRMVPNRYLELYVRDDDCVSTDDDSARTNDDRVSRNSCVFVQVGAWCPGRR